MHSNKEHIFAALKWLEKAQDVQKNGGVAAWYSWLGGWGHTYIETTGYIIDTFLDCAQFFGRKDLESRAVRMADFLLSVQHSSGGYRSKLDLKSQPVIFDTGQDLLGLTSIYQLTKKKKYLDSCIGAADFLCQNQEKDGSWLKYTYGALNHTYHTRVAWSLLKVYQVSRANFFPKAEKYKKAALKNLNWAMSQQLKNGWFEKNELPSFDIDLPNTHTICYVIEGFWWSGLILKDSRYLQIALRGAKPLLDYYLKNAFLPGTLDRDWFSADKYSCLTGNAQIALIWWEIYKKTKNKKFLRGAKKMNYYLKSKQVFNFFLRFINGAIAGSDPLWGDLLRNRGYCRGTYLSWATKFYIDSLLAEIKITKKK